MEEFFVQSKVWLGSSDKTLVILFIKIISIHTISFRYFYFKCGCIRIAAASLKIYHWFQFISMYTLSLTRFKLSRYLTVQSEGRKGF